MRLRALGFASYSAYLASAEWRAVKARYRASELPQECMCGEADEVQLHHTTYERVGAEDLTDLIPLCANCHAMVHALERRGDLGLDGAGLESTERAAAYAADPVRIASKADARDESPAETARRAKALWRANRRHGGQQVRQPLEAALKERAARVGRNL